MENDSGKLEHSPWKSHRTPNATVYSSPGFLSPLPRLERRKSGRSSSFGEQLDPFHRDLPVEYLKEVSSPIGQEELRPRKDANRKTYKPAVEKNNCYEKRTKDSGAKLKVTGVSSKPPDRRQQEVRAKSGGKKTVRFDEYDFPFREDIVFESGGKNGGRMTLTEYREARKLDKRREGSYKSKESQTPKESKKKAKSVEAQNLSKENTSLVYNQVGEKKLVDESQSNPAECKEMIFQLENPRESKSKPTVRSVEVVNLSLKNLSLGN